METDFRAAAAPVPSAFAWRIAGRHRAATSMIRATRIAAALMATLVAAAAITAPAAAAGPPPGANEARAEVQLGLCTPADRIVQALDLRPRGTPMRVWQFDDPDLTLLGRGVRLRLRVAADGRSEFTLKVADQDCARLGHGLVPAGEGKCEYDVYGATAAGAVSLVRRLGAQETGDLVAGRAAPAQVLGPAQTRYLREVVGVWPLSAGIRALGPIEVRTYRTPDRRYDVDISELPGGDRHAEISRKVPLAKAARTMDAMAAELARAGVAVCADQSSQAAGKLRALLR
jgi:hypothetical protein